MNDIDYQFLLASYQKKVSELINQTIVYDAKINSLLSSIAELNEKISKLESQKNSNRKIDKPSENF